MDLNIYLHNYCLIIKSQTSKMKYRTFFTTLLAYAATHMMFTSIPFVYFRIKQFLGITLLQLSLIGASFLLGLSLSLLWFAFHPVKKLQTSYFISMTASNLSFLIFPILISTNCHYLPLYYVSTFGFGFLQGPTWPILLSLVHAYFLPKQDGCMLGAWSSCGDLGNILGIVAFTIILFKLYLPFQVCMYFAVFCSTIMTILVYFLKTDQSKITAMQKQQQAIRQSNVSICSQYQQIIKQPRLILLLINSSLAKALIYGVLLWLPMYCDQEGFKEFQGVISLVINLMGIFGSVMIGLCFQKVPKSFRGFIYIALTAILSSTLFTIMKVQFTMQNRVILAILMGIVGFIFLGMFNIFNSLEVLTVCDSLQIQIPGFSSLSLCLAIFTAGLLQTIIGLKATKQASSVIKVVFSISIVVVCVEIMRAILNWRAEKVKNELKQQSVNEKQELPGMSQVEVKQA